MEADYKVHPAAELFPMINNVELRQLADDIKANGLLEPISLYNEMILDGRNRLAACKLAGVEPRFEVADLNGALPTVWVISKNIYRRHLTTSQRAAISADAYPLVQKDTLERQREGGRNGGHIAGRGRPATDRLPAKLPEAYSSKEMNKMRGEARHITGQAMHVGARTVQTAVAVKKADPELFERIKRGEVNLGAADRRIKKEACKKAIPSLVRNTESITKYQHMLDNVAKRRMINGLSQMRGLSRGLSEIKTGSLLRAFTPEELYEWMEIAGDIARQLRDFTRALKGQEVA